MASRTMGQHWHSLLSGLVRSEKNASELLGLKQGTAWPAPLNVANVSPSYSWNQALT